MARDPKQPLSYLTVPVWAQERHGGPLRSVRASPQTVSLSNPVSPIPPLLRVAEAASFLQVSSKTVRRFVARGDLKAVRIGRLVRIHSSEIDRLIAAGCPGGGGFGDGEDGD
jgi:excisionase family DNA binding protein